MSATRDKSQRVAFVYSNMYKIYKTGKGHDAAIVLIKDRQEPKPLMEDLKKPIKE